MLKLYSYRIFTLLFCLFSSLASSAPSKNQSLIQLSIVNFEQTSNTPTIKEKISDIIIQDLRISGAFDIQDSSTHKDTPNYMKDINYAYWKKSKQNYLLIGRIKQLAKTDLSIEIELVDIANKTRIIGLSFSTKPNKIRAVSHEIANLVHKELVGKDSDFSSQLAFVKIKKQEPKEYQLVIAEYDGFNQKTILQSDKPLQSLSWSPDGTALAYISFENGLPELFTQNLVTSKRIKWSTKGGVCESVSWSPNGNQLALTLHKNNNRDIYILDLESQRLHRKTAHRADDYNPSWGINGSSITYTSTRNKNRQLYKLDLKFGVEDTVSKAHSNYYGSSSPLYIDSTYAVTQNGEQQDILKLSKDGKENTVVVKNAGLTGIPSISANNNMLAYVSRKDDKSFLNIQSLRSEYKWRFTDPDAEIVAPVLGVLASSSTKKAPPLQKNIAKKKPPSSSYKLAQVARKSEPSPKYIKAAGRQYQEFLKALERYDSIGKDLYRITMSGKRNSHFLAEYWRENQYPIARSILRDLLTLYKVPPQNQQEYLQFQNTYGQIAWKLYMKYYGAITFPGGINPQIKNEMTKKSQYIKSVIDQYTNRYQNLGANSENILAEIHSLGWSYEKALNLAKEHYPVSKFPKDIKDAIEDIRINWHQYWDKMPETSEPKQYADKIISELDNMRSYEKALKLIEQEKYYPKYAVPEPVLAAVENVRIRSEQRRQAKIDAIADDGSYPLWIKRQTYFGKTMDEFGIVKGVYMGKFEYAIKHTPFKNIGARIVGLMFGDDIKAQYWGLEAYLRYQIAYFRWQCPAIREQYERQLVAFSYNDAITYKDGVYTTGGFQCLNCKNIKLIGKPAIADARKLLNTFKCDHIQSYTYNAYQMVKNKPEMLIKR